MEINHNGKYVLVLCPNPSIDIFASVDHFEIGAPNRITKEERYPGGKGIHVAMALAETDIEVIVIGFWGSMAGEWIKEECNRYYPNIKFEGPLVKEWSRTCYTFKEEKADGIFDDTEILGAGPSISEDDINEFVEQVDTMIPNAKALVLSGSWPGSNPEDAYESAIKTAKAKNVPSFLDCTGQQLQNALKADPYCVHLNRKEVTTYFNISDIEEAKSKLLECCSVAAITDGANGLYYVEPEREIHTVAKITEVISTIGSGDCLLAGIVAGHVKKLNAVDIAKLGAAYGAANCLRKELGMLYKTEVEQLFEEVEIKTS